MIYKVTKVNTSNKNRVLVLFVAAAMVLSALAVLYEIPHRSPGETAASQAVNSNSGMVAYSPVLSSAHLSANEVLTLLSENNVPAKYAYLPNLNFNATSSTGSPAYDRSPAPMGVSDFGLSVNSGITTTYSYTTSGFLGSAMFEALNPDYLQNGAQKTVAIQLSAVLGQVTVNGGPNNVFWIQNVMLYTPSAGQIQFVSNVWSLSSPSMEMQPGTILSGNGAVVPGLFYYYAGPTINVPASFTAIVYVDSVMNDLNNAVAFSYEITGTSSASTIPETTYDIVTFNSVLPGTLTPASPASFIVNGNAITPAGLLYDSELMVTGPGGGSTTSIYGVNGQLKLQYKGSTGSYSNVPAAFNYGSNTGETIQGLSVWWTGLNSPVAHLSPGPSILVPLWGSDVSKSGGTAIIGTVEPSNAFVFMNAGSSFDSNIAAWGPVAVNGTISYTLPGGLDYYGEVVMSEFEPYAFTTVVATEGTNETDGGSNTTHGGGSNTTHGGENETATYFNMSLNFNRNLGLYTPLYANGNDQLKYLTLGSSNFTGVVNIKNITPNTFVGDGTTGDPYIIENNQYSQLNQLFSRANDYMFPTFSGIQISNTNAYVQVNNPSNFAVKYPSYMSGTLNHFGLPYFNTLGLQFLNTSNIALTGGASISGWSPSTMAGIPAASVTFWNSNNFLVASNQFNSMGVALMVYNDNSGSAGGTIWGNHFTPDPITASEYAGKMLQGTDPIAILMMSSGNLIYNNYFELGTSVMSPAFDQFANVPAAYSNMWDLGQKFNLSYVNTVQGFDLSGSIVETSYQGGNYWESFDGIIPYSDSGNIAVGGDYYPLLPTEYSVTFNSVGLPSGTPWSVTLGKTTMSTTGTQIQFMAMNGTYAFGVTKPSIYSASPISGTALVYGENIVKDVSFSLIEHQITFAQTGHPVGESWSVNLSGNVQSTTGDNITYMMPNGTYSYSISGNQYYLAKPGTGMVLVNGADTTEPIQFVLGYFTATFNAAGLPAASEWSAIINGVAYSSTSDSLSVELPNGTYSYSIVPPTGYKAITGSGTFVVFGEPLTESVQFTEQTYTVSFNANGLTSGTQWGVNFSGQIVNTTSSSITFEVTDGNYTYEAQQANGYSLQQNATYVIVSGNNVNVGISYAETPNHALTAGLMSIGAVVGIAAGFGIAYMLLRKH